MFLILGEFFSLLLWYFVTAWAVNLNFAIIWYFRFLFLTCMFDFLILPLLFINVESYFKTLYFENYHDNVLFSTEDLWAGCVVEISLRLNSTCCRVLHICLWLDPSCLLCIWIISLWRNVPQNDYLHAIANSIYACRVKQL